jgi:hypothetical protein
MRHASIVIIMFSMTCIAQIRDPQVILESCAQAMGTRQQHHLQVIAQGIQSTNNDATIRVQIKSRGLEDVRMEREGPDQTEVAIISKGMGSNLGQSQRGSISRHTAAYFKADHLAALVCNINSSSIGMRLVYVGDEMVSSIPVFHLKLDAVPKGKSAHADAIESLISEYHLFIDQQTFRIVKTAKFVFSPNSVENRSLWETFYSDYRSINGVLMPFRIENFVSGHQFSTTVFTNIITDVLLSDQEFEEAK